MKKRTKIILFSSIIAVAVFAITLNFISTEFFSLRYWNPIKRVSIDNFVVRAEVVSSDAKRAQGLAGRTSLANDAGMLFLMPPDKLSQFWMKGMQIPLDIIWIENNKVIGCEQNISPSDTRIFSSPGFSSMVLEVNKGFCSQHDVKVNDDVKIQ